MHCGRCERLLLCLLAFVACVHPLCAQDSFLANIVQRLLRSELVGGGYRDTITWQASDSGTLAILRGGELQPHQVLRPPSARGIRCPGGTNRSGKYLSQPVGYLVVVEVESDSAGNRTLDVQVWCTFTNRGNSYPFGEPGKWVLNYTDGQWILGRQLEHAIT